MTQKVMLSFIHVMQCSCNNSFITLSFYLVSQFSNVILSQSEPVFPFHPLCVVTLLISKCLLSYPDSILDVPNSILVLPLRNWIHNQTPVYWVCFFYYERLQCIYRWVMSSDSSSSKWTACVRAYLALNCIW